MLTDVRKPLAGEGHGAQPDGPASGLLLTPPPALPLCESCGRVRSPLVWIDPHDGMGFHVCPTCHPDWRDR